MCKKNTIPFLHNKNHLRWNAQALSADKNIKNSPTAKLKQKLFSSAYSVIGKFFLSLFFFMYYSSSALLGNFSFNTYQSWVAIQIEEYAPQTNPAISGSENSRIDATPKRYSIITIIKVVIEV